MRYCCVTLLCVLGWSCITSNLVLPTNAQAQTQLLSLDLINNLWEVYRVDDLWILRNAVDELNLNEVNALVTDLPVVTPLDLGILNILLFGQFINDCLPLAQDRQSHLYNLRSLTLTLWTQYTTSGEASLLQTINNMTYVDLVNLAEAFNILTTEDLGITDVNLYQQFLDIAQPPIVQRIEDVNELRDVQDSYRVPYGEAVNALPAPGIWPVYDNTTFYGKPNLFKRGFKPIHIVGATSLLGNNLALNRVIIQTNALALPTDRPVCLDLELWHFDAESIDSTIYKLGKVARWIRIANPQLKFGFYNTPLRDYWAALHGHAALDPNITMPPSRREKWLAQYQDWRQKNLRLVEVVNRVHFVFPSLYTFYDTPEDWAIYAQEHLAAAQQYSKPVIPFLMPSYHLSAPALLRYQPLGKEYWRQQILAVRDGDADGLVIWQAPLGSIMQWADWKWWYRALGEEGFISTN